MEINFFSYEGRIAGIVEKVNEDENDENKIELLVGMQVIGQESKLTYVTKEGYPTNDQLYRSIGTGAPYIYVFLKPFYDNEKEITMEKVARLAYFTIRFIERFEIDSFQCRRKATILVHTQ